MNDDLRNALFMAAAFGLLFASAELVYRKFSVAAGYTRKYVHVSTGLLAMAFPSLFSDHWTVLVLCGGFLVILLVSMKHGLLPSINAVDRRTLGSLLFPVVVYGCFLAQAHFDASIFYYLPILVLAFGDPAAEYVGRQWPWGRYTVFGHSKTLSGSLAFLFVATGLAVGLLRTVGETDRAGAFGLALFVGVSTTVAEAVSHKGYDNLAVPAVATAILAFAKSCFSYF